MAKRTSLQTHQPFLQWPRQKRAKKILNISMSHLTRLISIITGFNCLSYIQFKANPTINPLCRLCGEDNETFWHFITDCPRLQTYRNDTFLDNIPKQDNWKLKQIMQFSTYPTIYNLMSYNQEYNEQPIYELDYNTLMTVNQTQLSYKTYTDVISKNQIPKLIPGSLHRAPRGKWGGAYRSRKGRAPWRGQCRQPSVGVPPLRSSG